MDPQNEQNRERTQPVEFGDQIFAVSSIQGVYGTAPAANSEDTTPRALPESLRRQQDPPAGSRVNRLNPEPELGTSRSKPGGGPHL